MNVKPSEIGVAVFGGACMTLWPVAIWPTSSLVLVYVACMALAWIAAGAVAFIRAID